MARRLSRDDIISNVYYNLETGFGSINETLKKAKEQDQTINRVDVETFMRKRPNKQIRKYRGSNSYTAPFARFEYQIDIMDMKPLTKEPETKIPIKNDEPRYGLVVIDIFSKLATSSLWKKNPDQSHYQRWKRVSTKWVFRCPFIVIMTVPSKRELKTFLRKKASLTSSP